MVKPLISVVFVAYRARSWFVSSFLSPMFLFLLVDPFARANFDAIVANVFLPCRTFCLCDNAQINIYLLAPIVTIRVYTGMPADD